MSPTPIQRTVCKCCGMVTPAERACTKCGFNPKKNDFNPPRA